MLPINKIKYHYRALIRKKKPVVIVYLTIFRLMLLLDFPFKMTKAFSKC